MTLRKVEDALGIWMKRKPDWRYRLTARISAITRQRRPAYGARSVDTSSVPNRPLRKEFAHGDKQANK